MAARKRELTTPDMVLLSLLAERPMHGYEANLELERRQVRDWAGISRPQVYYSLEKLRTQGLIRAAESEDRAAGPERSVFVTSAKGRTALAGALEREEWATQRERPIRAEVGHRFHEAVWMVSLTIEQFRCELRWLRKLSREMGRRAPARHPQYARDEKE